MTDTDLSKMSVQPNPCRTCPFEGEEPIDLGSASLARYTQAILNLESQHLCHSADNKTLCRGGRNIMLRVMTVKGLISEPTDEAFEASRKQVLGF